MSNALSSIVILFLIRENIFCNSKTNEWPNIKGRGLHVATCMLEAGSGLYKMSGSTIVPLNKIYPQQNGTKPNIFQFDILQSWIDLDL